MMFNPAVHSEQNQQEIESAGIKTSTINVRLTLS